MARRALVLMAKWPEPGAVKTRLGLRPADAAALYAAFLRDLVRAHGGRRYELLLAVHPAPYHERLGRLLGVPKTFGQEGADLGERIDRAVRRALDGRSRVVVAGTDLPDLSPSRVESAFRALRGHDAVLGPATDGGYYLVGLNEARDLFRDVPWSTPGVLPATLARAEAAGLRAHLLPPARDVDTLDDLRSRLDEFRSEATPATQREVERLLPLYPELGWQLR